jgi:hypothetical protein
MRRHEAEKLINRLNKTTFKNTRFRLNHALLAEMVREGVFGRGTTVKTLATSHVDPKNIIDFLVVREKAALNLPGVKRARSGFFERRYWVQRFSLEERPLEVPLKIPSMGLPATDWESLVTYEPGRKTKVVARPLFEFTSFFPEELYQDFLRLDLNIVSETPEGPVALEDREQIMLFSERYGYRFVPYDPSVARWDYFTEFFRQYGIFVECIRIITKRTKESEPSGEQEDMERALRKIEEMCHGFTVNLAYDQDQKVIYEDPDPGEHLIFLCYLELRRRILARQKLKVSRRNPVKTGDGC